MTAHLLQVRQVGDSLVDAKIIGVAEGCFRPQTTTFLEVLLQVTLFVFDVETRAYSILNDTGPEAAWCHFADPLVEDQLHPVRAAKVQIVSDHFFEEFPAAHRAVEDLRQAYFPLPDRKLVLI